MTIHRIRSLAIPILLTLTLTSCRAGSEGQDGVVTIRFWHSFVATTRPALAKLIDRFEAEHPHIRIQAQYVPTGDGLVQKLVASVESGTAPDISWVHADFLGKLAGGGAILEMRPFIEGENGMAQEELDDLFPGLLQSASWHDTLYAMPMEATLLALLYNKDQFRAAGIDPDAPPADWEELAAYARKLTRDVNRDGRMDHFGFYMPVFPASGPLNIWMVLQWTTFLWQSGGEVIDLEQTDVLYDSPEAVRALAYWDALYAEMGRPAFSMTHDVTFVAEQAAMIMDGPWDLPRFRQIENFEWGIAPLPRGPEEQVTYLAGEHLAIFRQSRHPDAAWEFVKWVLGPETQAFFSAESGYLPVRKSTLELPAYQAKLAQDPALRAFVEQMSMARTRRPIDDYHVEINRHIAEAIEGTLVGEQDGGAALARSAAKSRALLRE